MRWTSLVLSFFLAMAAAAQGQESAFFSHDFFNTRLAIRYEQGPAVFHYVIPCKQFSGIGNESELAICWPISAKRLRLINGKLDFTAEIPATLTVSATKVQFIPSEGKNMEFAQTVPIAQATFKHDASALTGMIGSQDTGYRFSFNNYCEGCHPGGLVLDPAKSDQLDAEFANVSESLKHFDQVYGRISSLARQIRFTISPANQPSLSDPHAAMRLYSTLNHNLAAACPSTASACVRSYESYQACQTGAPPVNCGPPPSCVAVCTLQPETIKPMKAAACEATLRDSATLFPFWIDVLKEEDAEAAAHPQDKTSAAPAPAGMGGVMGGMGLGGRWRLQPGWGSLAGMNATLGTIIDGFTSNHPEEACSVSSIYKRMKSEHLANMQYETNGAAPRPGVPRVSSGTMQGLLLKRVDPIYPAVAKAARVQGAVILRGIISRAGTVEDLTVISGPALLQAAAVDAVKQWIYKAYLINGQPTEVDTTITVNFTFGDGPQAPSAPPPQ